MKSCLLLGSNLGDREALLTEAQVLIGRDCGQIVKASKIYETEPWGFYSLTTFLNQALLIDTLLSPEILLVRCLAIETHLGRERQMFSIETYCSRKIDIDILFYESLICQTPDLSLPHPRLHLRKFVLEPLADVAPDWRHPALGLTVGEMLKRL